MLPLCMPHGSPLAVSVYVLCFYSNGEQFTLQQYNKQWHCSQISHGASTMTHTQAKNLFWETNSCAEVLVIFRET